MNTHEYQPVSIFHRSYYNLLSSLGKEKCILTSVKAFIVIRIKLYGLLLLLLLLFMVIDKFIHKQGLCFGGMVQKHWYCTVNLCY